MEEFQAAAQQQQQMMMLMMSGGAGFEVRGFTDWGAHFFKKNGAAPREVTQTVAPLPSLLLFFLQRVCFCRTSS
jgi:hypothetical protein